MAFKQGFKQVRPIGPGATAPTESRPVVRAVRPGGGTMTARRRGDRSGRPDQQSGTSRNEARVGEQPAQGGRNRKPPPPSSRETGPAFSPRSKPWPHGWKPARTRGAGLGGGDDRATAPGR